MDRSDSEGRPRVAYFTDTFWEVNGVALTSRQLEKFVRERGLPFLKVHCGDESKSWKEGSVETLQFKRSRLSVRLERDLRFDPPFLRWKSRAADELRRFRPDLIHVTSPGDIGILGVWLAKQLRIPLVAAWHTNVHEFGARRLERMLALLPSRTRRACAGWTERRVGDLLLRFYKMARVILAPSPELIEWLSRGTGRPVYAMRRGVDSRLFSPAKRRREDGAFVLGFTGRLSPEKNLRFLSRLERALEERGHSGFRFLIVGGGAELSWLKSNLRQAEFPGVLHGEDLAGAYADMDLFVFPSHTDTFGNVIQEAAASGVPAIVTSSGGPKFLVDEASTGFVAADEDEFIQRVSGLISSPQRLQEMRQAARRKALAASWERVFEDVYDAYRVACGDPASRLVKTEKSGSLIPA